MFDLSLGEIGVIALLVLVFFDADQLPGLMRQAGRIYAKVRGASDELRRAFNVEVARAEAETRREQMERRRENAARSRDAEQRPSPSHLPARPAPDNAAARPARSAPPEAPVAASEPQAPEAPTAGEAQPETTPESTPESKPLESQSSGSES